MAELPPPKCKKGTHKWGRWRRAFRLQSETEPFQGRVRQCSVCKRWQAQQQHADGKYR